MKRIIVGLLISILFLTACGQAPSATPTALVSAVEQATTVPFSTPTQTFLPYATPTTSITPLPTIPTFTATFNVSTIVTVTPAPRAECPKQNSELIPLFPIKSDENPYIDNSQQILEFLNQGGELKKAAERLTLVNSAYGIRDALDDQDVTGDGNLDLIFIDYSTQRKLHVFLCQNGQFKDITPGINNDTAKIVAVQDLNSNNLSDLALMTSCSSAALCTALFIFEWNGNEFVNLVDTREIFEGFTNGATKDMNMDGIFEVVITDDVRGDYSYFMGFPWRISTHIYMWNGHSFVLKDIQYANPEYLFQAVQDADRFTINKDFELAMNSYKLVISDNKLLPYSQELSEQMKWFLLNPALLGIATQPAPDLTEYPRLAAYAYYRILLLHIVQGQESESTTTYTTLQQTFGDDPYAHPYVEMATAFWEAYQSTQKMYDGCAAAIQYAVEHPEILIPLGSDYHGAQSHIYKPEDVCPFR